VPASERFIRFPTAVLERLINMPLTGAQWRILLWVIRRTWGWNKEATPFTWYQIAKELGLDRGATYRAGKTLLATNALVLVADQLAIPMSGDVTRQLQMPGIDVARQQQKTLPASDEGDACKQPERSPQATLFRRTKDSRKDRLKTKDRGQDGVPRHRTGPHGLGPALAGAATPIPGKYRDL
jgi:phage replication O-like protein O